MIQVNIEKQMPINAHSLKVVVQKELPISEVSGVKNKKTTVQIENSTHNVFVLDGVGIYDAQVNANKAEVTKLTQEVREAHSCIHTDKASVENSEKNALNYAKASNEAANDSELSAGTSHTFSIAAGNSASAAKLSETKSKESETNAKTSETRSKTSETNAKSSEVSANSSKTAASASEVKAKTSEANAKASETASKASETSASTSASIATTKASEASTSASNAKISEDKAKASETNSKASEVASKASENASKVSETNASADAKQVALDKLSVDADKKTVLGYKESAQASSENAKVYEAAALASKNAASTSQVASKLSETNAKASEVAAKASQTASKTSETNAATSASTSSTKASEASVSALNAKNSQDAAKVSEDKAKASELKAEQYAQGLAGGMVDGGGVDLSSGAFPSKPKTSTVWKVIKGGTVSGVEYNIGDTLFFSCPDSIFYKIDNTDAVASVNGKKGVVSLVAGDVNAYTKSEVDSGFLGKDSKAVDSDKLDGLNSTDFSRSTHTHTPASLGAVPISGGKLTGRLNAKDTDSFGLKVGATSNAVGLVIDKTESGRAGGIGLLSRDGGETPTLYMGWGESPWETASSFSVSTTEVSFKGHKVYHSGYKPTAADVGAYTKAEVDTSFLTKTAATTTYLGKTAQASDSKKLEGKTKDEVITEARNGLSSTSHKHTATDVGALPISGGTLTGALTTPDLNIAEGVRLHAWNGGATRGIVYEPRSPNGSDGYYFYADQLEFNSKKMIKENGVRVYSPNNKPTASELKVLPLTGGTITGDLGVGSSKFKMEGVNMMGASATVTRFGDGTYERTMNLNAKDGEINVVGAAGGTPHRVYHTGYKPTLDDVSAFKQFTKKLTLSNNWLDTGIAMNDLSSGSYMVSVEVNQADTGFYGAIFTGVMSWYAADTNSPETTEILLHGAGHSLGGHRIFLRTQFTSRGGAGLRLQISTTRGGTPAANYIFKFRKLI
ncbi:TPA: hypothetical protein ACPVXB_001025 [Vibrio parahaemolyticus]